MTTAELLRSHHTIHRERIAAAGKRSVGWELETRRFLAKAFLLQSDILNTHVIITRSYLMQLFLIKLQFDRLMGVLQRASYNGSALGRRLIGTALASAPSLSYSTAVVIFPLLIASVLEDASIPYNFELLTSALPCAATLEKLLTSTAADCIIWMGRKIRDAAYVYISCHKGHANGIGHFVKILSWWDNVKKRVETFTLDIDASDGCTQSCAEAIRHSLLKLLNGAVRLSGNCIDSGGGGVLECLADCLKGLGVTAQIYLVSNCTLHTLQLALVLANPVKAVFGDGGLDKRNVMQLIHCPFDLQNC